MICKHCEREIPNDFDRCPLCNGLLNDIEEETTLDNQIEENSVPDEEVSVLNYDATIDELTSEETENSNSEESVDSFEEDEDFADDSLLQYFDDFYEALGENSSNNEYFGDYSQESHQDIEGERSVSNNVNTTKEYTSNEKPSSASTYNKPNSTRKNKSKRYIAIVVLALMVIGVITIISLIFSEPEYYLVEDGSLSLETFGLNYEYGELYIDDYSIANSCTNPDNQVFTDEEWNRILSDCVTYTISETYIGSDINDIASNGFTVDISYELDNEKIERYSSEYDCVLLADDRKVQTVSVSPDRIFADSPSDIPESTTKAMYYYTENALADSYSDRDGFRIISTHVYLAKGTETDTQCCYIVLMCEFSYRSFSDDTYHEVYTDYIKSPVTKGYSKSNFEKDMYYSNYYDSYDSIAEAKHDFMYNVFSNTEKYELIEIKKN